MRVLVTGSVSWTDPVPVDEALNAYRLDNPQMIVITGMADGVDAIARRWAARHNVAVWAEPLSAGNYPGPMHRYNERMLSWRPSVIIACKPDIDVLQSPDAGTEHMCRIGAAAGVQILLLDVVDEASER